jgi:hypothetical protein
MGKQTNYEPKNAKKSLEDISMMSCCLIAIAMTVVVMADPSQGNIYILKTYFVYGGGLNTRMKIFQLK